jgi:hypothetical protein
MDVHAELRTSGIRAYAVVEGTMVGVLGKVELVDLLPGDAIERHGEEVNSRGGPLSHEGGLEERGPEDATLRGTGVEAGGKGEARSHANPEARPPQVRPEHAEGVPVRCDARLGGRPFWVEGDGDEGVGA